MICGPAYISPKAYLSPCRRPVCPRSSLSSPPLASGPASEPGSVRTPRNLGPRRQVCLMWLVAVVHRLTQKPHLATRPYLSIVRLSVFRIISCLGVRPSLPQDSKRQRGIRGPASTRKALPPGDTSSSPSCSVPIEKS